MAETFKGKEKCTVILLAAQHIFSRLENVDNLLRVLVSTLRPVVARYKINKVPQA